MLKKCQFHAESIKSFVKTFGLSETEMYKLLGITSPTMQKIYQGKTDRLPAIGVMNLYALSPDLFGYFCGVVNKVDFNGATTAEVKSKITSLISGKSERAVLRTM